MADLNVSEYDDDVFAVIPLFGDDNMVHVGANGDIHEDSMILLSSYCMSSDATTDTELYVNLAATEASTDLELPEVLGERVCAAANDVG